MKVRAETLSFPVRFSDALRAWAKAKGRKKSHLIVEAMGPLVAQDDEKFREWFEAYTKTRGGK